MTEPRTKSQTRAKFVFPDEEETLVPCPFCKNGMIHPATKAKIEKLLNQDCIKEHVKK